MRLWVHLLVLCACSAGAAPFSDVAPGLPTGAHIPRFSARDQAGKSRNLLNLTRWRGTFLIFLASLDWSPFCKAQALDAQREVDHLHELGWNVAAISNDSPEVIHHFAERAQIEFPILSDTESIIIRSFDLLDRGIPSGTPYAGAARPVVFLVNAEGIIIAKYFQPDFKKRYTIAAILARQFSIMPEAGEARLVAEDALVATGRTAITVRAGQTLGLSVELHPRKGTRAELLDWTIRPTPAFELTSDVENVRAPRSELHLFREITVAQDPRVLPRLAAGRRYRCAACGGITGDLKIEGTLTFRLCGKDVCSEPATVPLLWKARFEPYDSERVPWELQTRAAR